MSGKGRILELPYDLLFFIAVFVSIGVIAWMYWKHKRRITALITYYDTKQSRTFQLGQNAVRGDLNQILGTFVLLNEYEDLMVLSSTAKQGSLDLLGIKNDSVDFIEIKSGNPLSPKERRLKQLVDEKKVRYIVKDGVLSGYSLSDRPLKKLKDAKISPDDPLM